MIGKVSKRLKKVSERVKNNFTRFARWDQKLICNHYGRLSNLQMKSKLWSSSCSSSTQTHHFEGCCTLKGFSFEKAWISKAAQTREREKSGWGMAATRGGHTATSVWESGREKWWFIIKDAKAGKGHRVCPFQKLHNVLLRSSFHDLSACLDLAFLWPLIYLARLR